MRVDLHCHTDRYSFDASITPDDLVERARAEGLHGVCITEHDWFWDTDDVLALGRRHNFLVIPGAEINTEEGHILVYGVRRYVFGMHRAAFLQQEVEHAGGAMVMAHPYRRQFSEDTGPWATSYAEQLDKAGGNPGLLLSHGAETVNGRGSLNQNSFSRDLCHRHAIPGAGGSDAHDLGDVGTCATEFSRPVDGVASLIAELRAGRFQAVALRSPPPLD